MTKRLLIIVGAGIILLAVLAVGWYLASPLFINNEVDENFPEIVVADEMADDGVTAVLSGNFTDADTAHKGSGTANIYQQGEELVLRLQEFSVTNGPDLHVLLSTSANPTDDIGDYIDLGELKGNIGDQNYEIPTGTDLSQYQSVIIYCQPFHVVFSTATFG
jgi:hypothetical protein